MIGYIYIYIYLLICFRDSKMKGALIGITLNKEAVHRWLMSQAERSAITRQCEAMANINEFTRYNKQIILVF